ncbi:hypothetical protein CDD83_5601 [Cordyceps sp. RAO-2017]|nr:hypothetical protein CDD83_5601 [Cordyceps sp. RAO-2017]
MPASPQPSQHSRHSSITGGFHDLSLVRRRSQASLQEAASTSSLNNLGHSDGLDLSGLAAGGPTSEGLGNLADELADAFSESGEEDYNDPCPGGTLSPADHLASASGRESKSPVKSVNAIGIRDAAMLKNYGEFGGGLSIPELAKQTHQRKGSEYDGSEFGSESVLDFAGMSPTLITKIDAIESLARRGTESYGGPADNVFQRLTAGLKDLGPQSTVEGNASRLITAHSALTTHLIHQTRQLHSLTFPLLSPLVAAPDAETIDSLLPLLLYLSDDMPRPSTAAFSSLSALHAITSELIQTLSILSDTLHMSRQTTVTASRRLRSARELVSEIRRDEELREEGERWLLRGNWGERLQRRECAGVCGDVIGGFEDVCNGWRQRLLAQAESQA